MEIKISTNQVLKILHVISWIIFIGVSIEAGGIIFNAVFKLLLSPDTSKNLWQQVDLSNLYQHDHGHFLAVAIFMSIVAVLRATVFYLIVKFLHDKKLNMVQPFSKEMVQFIFKLSYLSFGIGLFSWSGVNYAAWIVKQGVTMPSIESLRLAGADVWLFMGVILIVIAQIFKRGMEIQTENELTV
jgi:ABC-type multidrug transport system fused ATPase/permease subunit